MYKIYTMRDALFAAPVTCTPHCLFFFYTRTASDANRIPILYIMSTAVVTFHTLGHLYSYSYTYIPFNQSTKNNGNKSNNNNNGDQKNETRARGELYARAQGLMGCTRLVVGNNRAYIVHRTVDSIKQQQR